MPAPFTDHFWPTRKLYEEWRRQADSFSDMAAFDAMALPESGIERPRAILTQFVSANFLPMLGTQASHGRLFQPEEEQPGQDHVVVLADRYFEKRFHSDPGAVGKTLALNGVEYTIIGVLPPRFRIPASFNGRREPEAFVPLSRRWGSLIEDASTTITVTAKLKPGVTISQARAELSGITARLHAADEEVYFSPDAKIFPFAVEDKQEDLSAALYVLVGAVGFVLLIACANLANLTLARATLRTREIAVRRALGASRRRIIAQLLSESFLVSVAGAAAGLLLAVWIMEAFRVLVPSDLQRPDMGGLSFPVFAFAAAASVLTTLLFGLMPAIAASRTSVNAALKTGGRTASAVGARSRQVLTVFEIAMAVVLLVGSGLLIRSFYKAARIGVGFNTSRLAVVDLDLPETRYPDAPSRERFLRSLLERARAIPGVTSAAITDSLPLHKIRMISFYRADRPKPPQNQLSVVDAENITPGYLSVIGVPLLAGRPLTEADVLRNNGQGDGVVLVNQAFAEKYLPGEEPLGVRLKLDNDRPYQIVGVVANVRAMGPEEEVQPSYFSAGVNSSQAMLILRTAVPPESLADDARAVLWSLDKELVSARVTTMESFIDESLAMRWFDLVLLATFAGLALLLAMIGVYSVLTNLVASRTREIGIRMALGAAPATIGKMIAGQSLRPIVIGLGLGVALSLGLGRVLESMLFQVTPRDPLTLSLAVAAVLLAAPLAIYLPLRRATRVECTEALREE